MATEPAKRYTRAASGAVRTKGEMDIEIPAASLRRAKGRGAPARIGGAPPPRILPAPGGRRAHGGR
jgi:hypothetical protein